MQFSGMIFTTNCLTQNKFTQLQVNIQHFVTLLIPKPEKKGGGAITLHRGVQMNLMVFSIYQRSLVDPGVSPPSRHIQHCVAPGFQ